MMVLVALKWARSTDLPAVDGRESLGIAMPTRWSACPSSTGRGSSLGSGKSVGCGARFLLSCQERRPPRPTLFPYTTLLLSVFSPDNLPGRLSLSDVDQ